MHFNFDMRIFRDDSLSILPTLPFNHLCADLKFYFHCLHTLITQLCFMFHPLKLKTHNTALSQANEWKIFDWVVRRILNRLKISFTRSRDPDCDTGTALVAAYFGQNWLKVFHKTMAASGGPSNQHFTEKTFQNSAVICDSSRLES